MDKIDMEIVLINSSAETFSTALLISLDAQVDLNSVKYNYPISKDEDGDSKVNVNVEKGTDGNIISNKPIVLDDSVFYSTSVIHTGESMSNLEHFLDGRYDNYYFDFQKEFFYKMVEEWENTNFDNYRERGFKESVIDYFRNSLDSCTLHYDFIAALSKQDMPLGYIYMKSRDLSFRKADYIELNEDGQIAASYDLTYIGEMAYMENYRKEMSEKIDGYSYFARKPFSYKDVKSYSISGLSSNNSQREPYRIFETVSLEEKEYKRYVNEGLLDSTELLGSRKEQFTVTPNGILQCIKLENKDNPDETILIHTSGYDYYV